MRNTWFPRLESITGTINSKARKIIVLQMFFKNKLNEVNIMAERPTGVTVICVIGALGALMAIVGGIGVIALSSLVGGYLGAYGAGTAGGILGGLGIMAGIVALVLGVASLIPIIGLWKMQKWGWTWTMVLQAISLIMSLASMNVLGIVIPAIIVYYLWTNKNLFR